MADFESSCLGTLSHWEETYERDLEVFKDNGDVGEIWFGEDSQERMVRWFSEKSNLPKSASMIDLGCGNGMLLLALREEGFTNLTGVDYSPASVELAKTVAKSEGVNDIIFERCDILSQAEVNQRQNLYDVCMDKGTYDAIGLKDTEDSTDCKLYIRHVHSMLKPNGLLVLTSCNWTREELEQHFCNDFDLVNEIPSPKFTFGGITGQKVTSLIFTPKEHVVI